MSDDVFGDGKDTGALRTIGEVGHALGLKAHILRYWEQQFPMLQPLKRSGGRRYYRAEDVALLRRIDQLLNREGYTVKGARAAIEGEQSGDTPAANLGEATPLDRAALLQELQVIRAQLSAALAD